MTLSRLSSFSIHADFLYAHFGAAVWLISTQLLVIQSVDTFLIPRSVALLPSDALNQSICRVVARSEYSNPGKF